MVRTGAIRTIVALGVLSLVFPGGVSADNAASIHAAASSSCPDPVKARNFDDDPLSLLIATPDGFDATNFSCSFKAENEDSANPNHGQKGVKGTGDGRIFNFFGNTIGTFNWPIKANSKGYDNISFDPRLFPGFAGATVDVNLKGPKKINRANVYCAVGNVPPCDPDDTTLCLNDNRFKVEVDWSSPSLGSGQGMVLNSRNNQGSFYFINPRNQDLLVQLLDACKNNDHFWVFYGATTSVEYDLTVTDTLTGEVRSYGNELGQPAPAITDTSAFATCP
jgi:hypothetical protein